MPQKKIQKTDFNPIWIGVYSSWEEAVHIAKGEDGRKGFSYSQWLNRIIQQLVEYRKEFKNFKIAVPPRPTSLAIVSSILKPKTIVDLGGSSGWTYEYISDLGFTKIQKYTILEIEEIVMNAQKFSHPNSKVKYEKDFKKVKSADLLYSNSVLQYFPDNGYLIQLSDSIKPSYILLDDLYAGDIPEFFSNQINYDKKIPHRFINFSKFNLELKKAGYELISKEPFHTPIQGSYQPKPMDNFPLKNRLRYSISVLYKRKK